MIPFDATFAAIFEFGSGVRGHSALVALLIDLLAFLTIVKLLKAAAHVGGRVRGRRRAACWERATALVGTLAAGMANAVSAAERSCVALASCCAAGGGACRPVRAGPRRGVLCTPLAPSRREVCATPVDAAPRVRSKRAPTGAPHASHGERGAACGATASARAAAAAPSSSSCSSSPSFSHSVDGRGAVGRWGVLLGVVVGTMIPGGADASLVGTIDTAADREVFVLRCTDLVRHRMDLEMPTLRGLEEQRALAAAEEFSAQRRYKEALVHYLHARSLAPTPPLHFLVGITSMHLKMYQHAEVALRKALSALEPSEEENPTTLYATTMLMLGHLDYQRPNPGDHDLIAGLKNVAKYPLKPHQKSFLLSGLAALIAADPSRAKLAEEPALEAHRLDESNAVALHVLGLIYMKRYIYARAREWLRKAAMQDDHPMHQKLLVRCVWVQFDGYEGVRDKDKSIQAHLELANTYKYSPVASMGLVMAYANSKKYYSALKESNRTLELFLTSTNQHMLWDAHDPMVIELLSLRLVCLMLHSHYAVAFREMMLYTDMGHPVTAATVAVLVVCSVIILILAIIFGWEGCIIGAFGLILLVLRGVLTMILLSAVNSTYQSMMHEPFPIASVLNVV